MANPMPFLLVIEALKNKAPMMTTNKGVIALKTPVSEELSCVWAFANKKAGIKLPINPTIIRFFTCLLLRFFNRGKESGNRTIPAATIRNAPTSPGEKISRPLLIKIKELPQIKASTIRNPHAFKAPSAWISLVIFGPVG
jgi:hypothetical protein